MMFRAVIALIALALPAFAQHGGAHAGSFGNRGFSRAGGTSSHPAFSHPGFSGSPSFARPAQPARYPTSRGPRYGSSTGVGSRAFGPPNHSSLRTPYNGSRYSGNRFPPGRSSYDPMRAGPTRGRDRDRFDARRRQFQGWYVNTYPNWSGYGAGYPYPRYPFLPDPNLYNLGLYNWGDSDNSASGNYESDNSAPGGYAPDQAPASYAPDQNGPAPLSPPSYPSERPRYSDAAPSGRPAYAAPSAPSLPTQPLTVIFKSGRAPIEVENYLMTAKVLTDLDSDHYEQIPLDQIDLAATRRFNTFAGVEFQVPAASRN